MKINDNGHVMKNGEQWWVAWFDGWNKKIPPKLRVGIAEGDRPYQQVKIAGEYPSEVWIIRRADDMPELETVVDNGTHSIRRKEAPEAYVEAAALLEREPATA